MAAQTRENLFSHHRQASNSRFVPGQRKLAAFTVTIVLGTAAIQNLRWTRCGNGGCGVGVNMQQSFSFLDNAQEICARSTAAYTLLGCYPAAHVIYLHMVRFLFSTVFGSHVSMATTSAVQMTTPWHLCCVERRRPGAMRLASRFQHQTTTGQPIQYISVARTCAHEALHGAP